MLVLIPIWAPNKDPKVVTLVPIPFLGWWMKVFLVIRALRPLHLISILPVNRRVVRELVEGWRNLLLGTAIMFGFIFMFASLGVQVGVVKMEQCATHVIVIVIIIVIIIVIVIVQLFSGTAVNPQAFCNDHLIHNERECVGEFIMKLRISRELLAKNNITNEIRVPRVWSVLL